MTLVEFIAPLSKKSHRDRILAALYFCQRYEKLDALTVEQIKEKLKRARAPQWAKANISDILAKSGHYVDTPGIQDSKRLWSLTSSGNEYVRKLLSLPSAEPELEHDAGSLEQIIENITDLQIKDYLNESLKCLQIGALRACVVFLWSGAIRIIQNKLLLYKQIDLNNAIKKHDPKARKVKTIDQFAYIKDKTVLLASLELGLFDKNEKGTLEEALDLRNRCGHPGKYKPGVKKVSSFIEDLVSIVFE